MKPRERVLAALNHQETDRVPIDLSGHRSSGISAIAYPKLRRYLGLEARPIQVYDIGQELAIVDDDVLDRFGIDTIELGRGFALEDKDWIDWTLPDGTPCRVPAWSDPQRDDSGWVLRAKDGRARYRMPDGALYFDAVYYPFTDGEPRHESVREVFESFIAGQTPPGPLVDGPEGDARFVEGARRLREQTDRAIIGLFGGNLMEGGEGLYGFDNFLAMMADEPDRMHDLLEKLTEMYLVDLGKYLRLVGPYIDIILFGDDLGTQNGPLISPKMYREFIKPRHTRMWKRAKELANVKVMLHCCGGVRPLLPDLIDGGLDAINPVQISSRGMDAEGLKRDFGKDIALWGGGCDTQWILSHASPAEVREHVAKQVRTMRPGGGFVFQQVHNILADVPPENIVAMLDTVNQAIETA